MKAVRADLHIHTGLSPCASQEMTPPAVVTEAMRKGLGMIAICDHNTAGNARAVMEAASNAAARTKERPADRAHRRDAQFKAGSRTRRVPPLVVISGIEITTSEEVHVLGLFADSGSAEGAASEVLETLPFDEHGGPPEGQHLLDAEGRITGRERRMLFAASGFGLAEAVALIRRHGGLAVASHVDRPSFSVSGQLGVFPDDVRFDALEISAAGFARGRQKDFAFLGVPLVCSSDSHYLEDIGSGHTVLDIEEPAFGELARALRGEGERRCRLA